MKPEAVGEPTEDVRWSWTAWFNVAWAGVMVGLYGPIQILLPNQTQSIDPQRKELVLAWVFGVGALFALVTNPLWGALSDRTASRYGMRIPWIVIGTIGGALGLVLLATATTVAAMIGAWCLVASALNAPWAALTAAVSDHVPMRQRGTASGWVGLAQILGVVIATGLATAVPGPAGYLACALVLMLSVVPYVLLRCDIVLPRTNRPPWNPRAFIRGFWISPARHPEFGWAWLTRFLINLGYAIILTYLLYFLRDQLQVADAESAFFVLALLNAAGVGAAVVLTGLWSDRLGRRKIFISSAGLIMASAMFLIAGIQTWSMATVAAVLLGIGFGAFASVDLALITQVLPVAQDRAKDLGILNIASALPQVIAPAIAAPIVTSLGGYPVLFALSGVISVLGSAFVVPIKSVP